MEAEILEAEILQPRWTEPLFSEGVSFSEAVSPVWPQWPEEYT